MKKQVRSSYHKTTYSLGTPVSSVNPISIEQYEVLKHSRYIHTHTLRCCMHMTKRKLGPGSCQSVALHHSHVG